MQPAPMMRAQPPRPNMAVTLLVLCLSAVLVHNAEGACDFPTALQSKTWTSSRWGSMVVTTNQVTVTGLSDIGTVIFECEINNGNVYVLRSTTTVTVLSNTLDVITCLDLNMISSSSYYYYHATNEVQLTSGTEPFKLVQPSSSVTEANACDISAPYHEGTNHMLILSGSESAAAQQCSNPMLATFDNYTIDMGSGAQCNNIGYINACDNTKNVTVDLTVCSDPVFYSSAGNLQCVYSTKNGTTYFQNLYNFDATVDDSTTYRFTCVALEYGSGADEDWVFATQYPNACKDIQTPTVVSGGGTLQLSSNFPSAAEDGGSSVGIIIAILFLLIILILVALAVYHLYYRKRWPMVKEKLPCFKGGKGQVEPQMDDPEDELTSSKERPKSGAPPSASAMMVTTAVVTDENMKRLQSSQSARSVATPSKLQPEINGNGSTEGETPGSADATPAVNPTPRRLPPIDGATTLPEGGEGGEESAPGTAGERDHHQSVPGPLQGLLEPVSGTAGERVRQSAPLQGLLEPVSGTSGERFLQSAPLQGLLEPVSFTAGERVRQSAPTQGLLEPVSGTAGEIFRQGAPLPGLLEPIVSEYLPQARIAPLETVTSRFSEESESSDCVSLPPRLPAIHENQPVHQNM